MAAYQSQIFDEIGASRKGEGPVVNIEELEDLMCCVCERYTWGCVL
jgi:hypothetical protein